MSAKKLRLRVAPFFLRDSRASETRARVKITPREKRRHALSLKICACIKGSFPIQRQAQSFSNVQSLYIKLVVGTVMISTLAKPNGDCVTEKLNTSRQSPVTVIHQEHPTTVFCKISVRRSKNSLEFSIA